MYQTSFFRNSDLGQWRYYELTDDMTPKNIDWQMFLGTEFSLAPNMPFDRAKFDQWRCYWDFGAGMFTDLFVHRTTAMLKATGLRFPGRVVGAGGIYLEYDDRDVPDVATVVADFPEGVQGLVTATMCCQETPIPQLIRGHHGSFVLGNGEEFAGYDFVAERPQATHNSKIKDEHYRSRGSEGLVAHAFHELRRFRDGRQARDVNCSPELGAAAMVIVKLGSKSYREGKVFHFDREYDDREGRRRQLGPGLGENVARPRRGQTHSRLERRRREQQTLPREYQKLAGPWINGVDPAGGSTPPRPAVECNLQCATDRYRRRAGSACR